MKQHLRWLIFATTLACLAHADGIKVLNADAHFPEGPVWYLGKLYYVEYDRNTVMTWDGRRNRVFWFKKGCGPSAVVPTARGEFLTTCYDNGTIGRISADGKDLPAYTHDEDGGPFVGPNDFAPDRHGGIYFTASGDPGPAINGKIYYIAADGTITRKAADVHSANGIAVSPDGKVLYVVETEAHRLIRFTIGPDASLSERRVFLNLDDLTNNVTHIYPDGMKIDSKGAIYIGQTPRSALAPLVGTVFVVDAEGRLLRTLSLPSPGVPNLAFSADQATVYVMGLDQLDKPPYQGKVYSVARDLAATP
jgi:sugar lactone lactonase YvrE